MGTIGCPETSVTTNLCCVTSQRNEDTVNAHNEIKLEAYWTSLMMEKSGRFHTLKRKYWPFFSPDTITYPSWCV